MKMFKLALLGLALVATPAAAQTTYTPEEQARRDSMCESLEGLARQIMIARQRGTPMSTIMAIAMRDAGDLTRPVFRQMVQAAFDEGHPRYETESYQTRAVEDFATEWATLCYSID